MLFWWRAIKTCTPIERNVQRKINFWKFLNFLRWLIARCWWTAHNTLDSHSVYIKMDVASPTVLLRLKAQSRVSSNSSQIRCDWCRQRNVRGIKCATRNCHPIAHPPHTNFNSVFHSTLIHRHTALLFAKHRHVYRSSKYWWFTLFCSRLLHFYIGKAGICVTMRRFFFGTTGFSCMSEMKFFLFFGRSFYLNKQLYVRVYDVVSGTSIHRPNFVHSTA